MAARELNISSAAVSKRLTNLEKKMECQLLHRTTRAMSPTSEGLLYLEHAQQTLEAFDRIANTLRLNRSAPEGLIRINAPFGFGRQYMAAFVSDFVQKYPQINCQLDLSDRPLNLVSSAFDLGIRFGTLPDSGLHARKVASHQRLVCASPSYLEAHGLPRKPQDLINHNCLVLRQNEDTQNIWRFRKGGQDFSIRVNGNLSSNDGESVLTWALDHHGIAIRAAWDVWPYLEEQSLTQVLPAYELPNADIYAVYPHGQHLPYRVRLFIDYLAERMARRNSGAAQV